MAGIPMALQLWSVRADCAADLPGTLRAVAEMGFDGVEFAGYHGRSAEELRALLDDLGLRCAGTHTPLATILGDALPATVEFNHILGNPFLIVPSMPAERRASRADWLATARLFNEASERAAELGAVVGYHNHAIEFQELEGELPWDTFFANTRPEVVMQVDIGNAAEGGGNAIPYISRYPGRARTVHLKEYSRTNREALIGEGDVNWPEVFDLCESVGATEWYIVEQETYPFPALECARRCLNTLRAMGK